MDAFPGETKLQIFKNFNDKNIHTNILHLMANDSVWYKYALQLMKKKGKETEQVTEWKKYFSEFDKNLNHIWKMVDGNHHFHLNSPETAIDMIDKWLANGAGAVEADSSEDVLKAWGHQPEK